MSDDPLQGRGEIEWYAWPIVAVAFVAIGVVTVMLLIIKVVWWICEKKGYKHKKHYRI